VTTRSLILAGLALASCTGNSGADAGGEDAGPCSGCEIAGCQIGGVAVAAGAANPLSSCQVCAPPASRTGWTNVLDGTVCDGGAVCGDGTCLAGCFLDGFFGAPEALDPLNDCLSCQPSASVAEWSAVADGTPCATDGGTFCAGGLCRPLCSVGGVTVADGTLDGGNPDVCCNVALDPTGWTPGFAAGLAWPTASEPSALVAGDLNGDGVLDLAVCHPSFGSVGILTGQGDGGFGGERLLTVGSGPRALALADFDGDGRLDLAVVNGGDATVDVLLQRGGFADAGARLVPLGLGPTAIGAADLNGDGKVDLVVTDQGRRDAGENEVSVFLGNGDGTFQAPVGFAVGLEPVALAVADLDGDGLLDVATANAGDSTVSILFGRAGGGFSEPPVALALPGVPLDLLAVDLDGDGFPDLAAAAESADGGALAVFANPGQGAWSGSRPTWLAAGRAVAALAAGDFDGNGLADLAILDQGEGRVAVFLDRSIDGGTAFATPASYAAGRSPSALVPGDFNGDGRADLAIADTGDGRIWVLLGACP